MKPTRRVVGLGLGAALVAGALAGPAAAGGGADSEVTLKLGDGIKTPPAHGRVISDRPECVAGRVVKLVMVAPGNGIIDFADRKTNAKGKWVFTSQLQGATAVRAEVKRRKVGEITCKADSSPVKEF
ncbi:MAG TPA: hypothetical protein VHH72_07055 [Solirubrobacterales bacterium]|nr:hypothetical protein [Solirubrobacterales bacterium]